MSTSRRTRASAAPAGTAAAAPVESKNATGATAAAGATAAVASASGKKRRRRAIAAAVSERDSVLLAKPIVSAAKIGPALKELFGSSPQTSIAKLVFGVPADSSRPIAARGNLSPCGDAKCVAPVVCPSCYVGDLNVWLERAIDGRHPTLCGIRLARVVPDPSAPTLN